MADYILKKLFKIRFPAILFSYNIFPLNHNWIKVKFNENSLKPIKYLCNLYVKKL